MHDYDTSKLHGRIIEKYGSQKDFVKAMREVKGSASGSGLSRYLSGQTYLSQPTIDKWADMLDIPAEEIPIFFFTKRVHETEQESG